MCFLVRIHNIGVQDIKFKKTVLDKAITRYPLMYQLYINFIMRSLLKR